jgi:uncharacterized protein YkwD
MHEKRTIAVLVATLGLTGCIVIPAGGPVSPQSFTAWPSSANCAAPENVGAASREVLSRINAIRANAGLGQVRPSAPAAAAARGQACDNAARNAISHVGSDGSNLLTRLGREGVRPATAIENVGLGFANAETAVNWWMNSPGHRANILNPQVTGFGAAVVPAQNGKPSWVLVMLR